MLAGHSRGRWLMGHREMGKAGLVPKQAIDDRGRRGIGQPPEEEMDIRLNHELLFQVSDAEYW